jgi:hypothetical protein
MVVSPKLKKMFLIDVKGLYRPNPWVVKRKAVRDGLYYVFALDAKRFAPRDAASRQARSGAKSEACVTDQNRLETVLRVVK